MPGSGTPVEERRAAKALVPSWGQGSEYYLLENRESLMSLRGRSVISLSFA